MKGYHDPAYPKLKRQYNALYKRVCDCDFKDPLFYYLACFVYESDNLVLIKQFEVWTESWVNILGITPKEFYYDDVTSAYSLFTSSSWGMKYLSESPDLMSIFRIMKKQLRFVDREKYRYDVVLVSGPVTHSNIKTLIRVSRASDKLIQLINYYSFEPCFHLLTLIMDSSSEGYNRYMYKLLEYIRLTHIALEALCYDVRNSILYLIMLSFIHDC